MEGIHKVIILLLVIAIVFSIVSTLINFSLLDFEFKPADAQPEAARGNTAGNLNLMIEGNSVPGGER